MGHHPSPPLGTQLASFVAGGQIWNNVVAVLIPCLCRKNRARREEQKLARAGVDPSLARNRSLLRQAKSKAWHEARLQEYDTFQDYTEMSTCMPSAAAAFQD